MKRRTFLERAGAGAVVAGLTPADRAGAAAWQATAVTPEAIYKRSYATDAQCFGAQPPAGYVPYLTEPKIAALRTSGITAVALCMTVAEDPKIESEFEATKDLIVKWDAFVAKHGDVFAKVQTAAELEAVKRNGKVGFIYNFQGTTPFGLSLAKLDTFVSMGVRQIQLSHDWRNYVVDGCRELSNAGLSKFGYAVVDALNAKRVVVDVTHVGERSTLDAILQSKAPVLFSHSGCYALCPHPRNVPDRNIRAMADRGGVFCVFNQSAWLTRDPTISIDHFIAHVARVIQLGGEDHVGVGTDGDVVDMSAMRPDEVQRHQALFDRDRADQPQLTWPVKHMRVPELSHPQRLLHLAQALDTRGYKPRVIEKIIGGNYVRLFKEVVG